jgi:SAM-dependent methyltransferase
MGNFQIALIRPQGYLHTEAFREIAETLQAGLEGLRHTARVQENICERHMTNIVLGAHLLTAPQMQNIPAGSIIYNLEQMGGAPLRAEYTALASRHRIWDYDARHIAFWKSLNCAFEPVHVPVGYVPGLNKIKPHPVQDIDVLFYGSINPRRRDILVALKNAGLNVHVVFGVYGKDRDDLISRSRVVLNVHFYESKVFEMVRVSYLLSNSKAVVSECASETELEPGVSSAITAVPYDKIVETCTALVKNDAERKALEARGFQWFSQRKESEILARVLQPAMTESAAPAIAHLPRKLNFGSGKDWREDYFNADFDPYWEPDAVLDFSRALPIGRSIQTHRFGAVTLQNNYFDEIIANDALEHIPNLTLAMTSCLNLLRVGGLFHISVPYDLSWGAWQDPTHVRAFNERSWLYYTDWFWYMGWTEARFDIAHFDLGLSPIGEALAKQNVSGEDLARHPRAVDQLRVVLRKRLLTEQEKQMVGRYLKRPNRSAMRAPVASVKTQAAHFVAAP